MMNTTTTTATDNNNELIHLLSLGIVSGTLKRIYSGGQSRENAQGELILNNGSANALMLKLRNDLYFDNKNLTNLTDCNDLATTLDIIDSPNSLHYGEYHEVIADNNEYLATKSLMNYVISDAYDLYMTAYTFLWEKMIVEEMSIADTYSVTLKNGTTKERNIYQWACVEVRKAIYAEKRLENNGKYLYIEDMPKNDEKGETSTDALDREYTRLSKYYDMGGNCRSGDVNSSLDGIYSADNSTAESITEIMENLDLTKRQRLIVHYRLQGLSISTIANKLDVSQSAISQTIQVIQRRVMEEYPELARATKTGRISQRGRTETNSKALFESDYITAVNVPENAQKTERHAPVIELFDNITFYRLPVIKNEYTTPRPICRYNPLCELKKGVSTFAEWKLTDDYKLYKEVEKH